MKAETSERCGRWWRAEREKRYIFSLLMTLLIAGPDHSIRPALASPGQARDLGGWRGRSQRCAETAEVLWRFRFLGKVSLGLLCLGIMCKRQKKTRKSCRAKGSGIWTVGILPGK